MWCAVFHLPLSFCSFWEFITVHISHKVWSKGCTRLTLDWSLTVLHCWYKVFLLGTGTVTISLRSFPSYLVGSVLYLGLLRSIRGFLATCTWAWHDFGSGHFSTLFMSDFLLRPEIRQHGSASSGYSKKLQMAISSPTTFLDIFRVLDQGYL